jgi:hypothetical protein
MADEVISDQLRRAITSSDKSRYRISLETGISESILSRFVNRGAGLSLANIDKLGNCIGAKIAIESVNTTKAKSKASRTRKSRDER